MHDSVRAVARGFEVVPHDFTSQVSALDNSDCVSTNVHLHVRWWPIGPLAPPW